MWTCRTEPLANGRTLRLIPDRDDTPLAYRDVLQLWRDDDSFRGFFLTLLREAPFTGYRWETPPITAATAGRAFEFVLIDAPELDRTPDHQSFAGQFRDARGQVAAFPSLGKDATLIVPTPTNVPAETYVHLASFVRGAPDAQQHQLLQTIADVMLAQLGEEPRWLSTAGMGVAWLHVRVDTRPKYYGHMPYRAG